MGHDHLKGNNPLRQLIVAFQIVFEYPTSAPLFLLFAIAFFLILIAIPAFTVPGNDFFFQIEILTLTDFLLLATLAILTSLSLAFHLCLIKNRAKDSSSLKLAGQTGANVISGILASIFATASCSACVASIFGFLGFGAVIFLLEYRLYIVSLAIVLNTVSLYFLSKKVLGLCQQCKIN